MKTQFRDEHRAQANLAQAIRQFRRSNLNDPNGALDYWINVLANAEAKISELIAKDEAAESSGMEMASQKRGFGAPATKGAPKKPKTPKGSPKKPTLKTPSP
jgi:hypothetical protein